MDLKGKNVIVVGLGASGVAAARLCRRLGAEVTGADDKPAAELSPAARALGAEGIAILTGDRGRAALQGAHLIVISPGVPSFAELEAAASTGVEIIGEVELATRFLASGVPIVAIGGTNGKSTVTSLTGALLEAEGRKTFIGGNLGEPLANHVDAPWAAVVLEVSSFQMERVSTFAPRVSVLLNVTPDHLDRYSSFDAYVNAKGNAFVRQTPDDLAVVPHGDVICLREARRGAARIVTFGPGGTIDVSDTEVHDTRTGARYPRSSFNLAGGHNALNVAAAVAVAGELGVSPKTIARVLKAFSGLPHRMVLVGEIRGVRYYDDSKGTNVGAVVTALQGLGEPKAVLIAGGRDKGGSYEPLAAALRAKGRAAVLIGEAADAIAAAIWASIPVRRAGSMDDAVKKSAELAVAGDAVILSPACSSFDMFRDYKERGDAFVRAVGDLAARSSGTEATP